MGRRNSQQNELKHARALFVALVVKKYHLLENTFYILGGGTTATAIIRIIFYVCREPSPKIEPAGLSVMSV